MSLRMCLLPHDRCNRGQPVASREMLPCAGSEARRPAHGGATDGQAADRSVSTYCPHMGSPVLAPWGWTPLYHAAWPSWPPPVPWLLMGSLASNMARDLKRRSRRTPSRSAGSLCQQVLSRGRRQHQVMPRPAHHGPQFWRTHLGRRSFVRQRMWGSCRPCSPLEPLANCHPRCSDPAWSMAPASEWGRRLDASTSRWRPRCTQRTSPTVMSPSSPGRR